MYTIKSLWEAFNLACLQGVSEQQRHEAHTAFYAGAASILRMQLQLGKNGQSQEEKIKHIQGWEAEIIAFTEERLCAIASAGVRH